MRSPYFQAIGRCLFAGHFRQLAMKNQDSASHCWREFLIALSPNLPLAISTTATTTDHRRREGRWSVVVARAYACFVAASSSCWRRGTISAGLG